VSTRSAAVASSIRSTRSRERSWLGLLRGVSWSVLLGTVFEARLAARFTGKAAGCLVGAWTHAWIRVAIASYTGISPTS